MKLLLLGALLISLLLNSGCENAASNRAKWEAAGIMSYRMKVAISKPGHGTPVGTYLITVSDGKAVEIRVGETVITDRTYPINFGPYETIEDYFDIVDRLTSDKMSADVRFDPTYGYPKYISFRGRGVDNELNLEVLEFTNLS